ncbi:energy transducer TonB [Limibacter armeniacum]|uniref:energy transducer TonB n=1 Tax=Limibacter armeniacum TaxID=466084 RepID=UPI002FE56292
MAMIKDVKLKFACPKKLDEMKQRDGKYFCDQCSKQVTDFMEKTEEEMKAILSASSTSICGIFNVKQVSSSFLKYAAATLLTSAIGLPIKAQEYPVEDTVAVNEGTDIVFGEILETQPILKGGYKDLIESVKREVALSVDLKEKVRVYVQFTVDTLGNPKDFKVVRGYTEAVDKVVLKSLSSKKMKFEPGRQSDIPVAMEVIIPIIIDPKRKGGMH